jgi:acyl-CoA thioester hydrolase
MLLETSKAETIVFQQRYTMYKKVMTPRICEVNGARHIGHNVIPVWMEEGCVDIIRLFTPDIQAEAVLIMKNIHIDFINEIFLGEDVEIVTGIKKIGTTSLAIDQKIYQGGRLCTKGMITFVHFDFSAKKPKPIPPTIRQKLEKHMVTD